jgi:hypothetical protein
MAARSKISSDLAYVGVAVKPLSSYVTYVTIGVATHVWCSNMHIYIVAESLQFVCFACCA